MISLQAGSGGRSTKQRSQHLLRSGENHLSIVVYNSASNRLAGRALPDYRLLNGRYGQRFTPQDVEVGNLCPPACSGDLRF